MGFGLPSAIGAKVAAPEKIVVDIDGDASFSMTAMELATASQYNIGVKVLVLNNLVQGMVSQWQGERDQILASCKNRSSQCSRRSLLRRPTFPYRHGKPRLHPPRSVDGSTRHPMSKRR
jgi:TPP-dependent trihydroxycyclohexane-1,2-dione (THcHDO) dehydratase